ncbi:MAG: translocation/assembly module TamB domain-containing protein [Terriglobia bacterium]
MKYRRVFLVILLLVMAGWIFLLATFWLSHGRIEASLRTRLIESLDGWTGGKSSVGALTLHFFPPRLLITQLRIESKEPSTNPSSLSIPIVEVRPRWRDLWFFSFQIQRLRIVDPSVRLSFEKDLSSSVPAPKVAFDPFLLHIHHLSIENGELQIQEKRSQWNLDLEGVHVSADRPIYRESYLSRIGYEKGTIQWDKNRLSGGFDLTCEWLRNTLKIQQIVVTLNNSRVEAEGVVENLASPEGTLFYHGQLQADDIHPYVPQMPELKGILNLKGQLAFSTHNWQADGQLEASKLSVSPSQIDRLGCVYSLSSNQFHFQKIELEGLKGNGKGNLLIDDPFGARRFRTELLVKGVQLSDIVRIIGLKGINPTGRVEGFLRGSWVGLGRNFSGEGHLIVLPSPGQPEQVSTPSRDLPLRGELNFSADNRNLSFHDTSLQLEQSRLKLDGTITPAGDSTVRLEFHSGDLREFAYWAPELQGVASFEGFLRGTRQAPELEGHFSFHPLVFGKYQADEMKGSVQANLQEILLHHTTLKKGSSTASLSGRLPLDPATRLPDGSMDFIVHAKESWTEDLVAMIGRTFPVKGKMNGELLLKGSFRQPLIDGKLVLREGQFLQQPLDRADVSIEYRDPILEVSPITLTIGSGQLIGTASINLQDQTVQSKLQGSGILLSQLPWVHLEKSTLAGSLEKISLEADGPFRRPALKGQVELKSLSVAGEKAGDFLIRLDSANQVSTFAITSMDPSVQLNAEGTVALDEALSLNAQLTFNKLILTPYLIKVLPVAPEKVSSQAAGQVTVTGPLMKPEELKVTGSLHSVKIQFREAQLQSSKPFEVAVAGEKATIQNAEFTGKGTVLILNGSIDLTGKGQLNLAMKGDFNLALLNEFSKNLTATGNGTVNAQVRGTLHDPRIQGQGKLSNAQFGYAGFPNTLSQTNGTLYFDENQIRIENITGSSGSGKLTLTGTLLFGEEKITMLNLKIQGREVRIRYPEGMRNVVDADLALRGSQQSQVLSGNVRVVSASFQKGYDPLTQYLESRSKTITWPGSKDFGNELHLDLTIGGDRSIKLDTPLLRTMARADLKVKGTAARPFVTGALEASEGDVYFQGVRYRLTRGRVDFLNPVRIDPRIDLEAEGDVRDYRIVLNLSGTLDKLRANIRSDPPLPTVDIFNLVATGGSGKTGMTSSSYRPYTTGGLQQDSSSGASALLSEGLSLKMGSRVKRLFGLDSFRVDPLLIGNERDPTTRVTMGQQVTKNLAITYSTNVSNNEQQVIYIEYFLNDSTTLIGSRDIDGAFGLDIRFRKRLRQKNR